MKGRVLLLNSKAFQATVWLLLVFLVILVGQHIAFVFRPIAVLITTIFFPVLVAGVLFYLTNPIVNQLCALRIPRSVAIVLVFLFFGGVVLFASLYLVPIVQQQFSTLVANVPQFLRELDKQVTEFQQSTIFSRFEQFEFFRRWANIDYMNVLDRLVDDFLENILAYLGSLVNFFVILFTIPILLFYMLRDNHKLSQALFMFLPENYQHDGERVLSEMSRTLSAYIQGILIVSLFVGVLVYIGYSIIGLEYAALLSLVAMFTNIIPYFGPILGTIPGLIVGLIASPWTALQVLIMVLIVQQLESQLVAPVVIGKKLRIHPVTVIVILLTAGSLVGLLGVILAVPTYATAKVIITHVYSLIIRTRKGSKEVVN